MKHLKKLEVFISKSGAVGLLLMSAFFWTISSSSARGQLKEFIPPLAVTYAPLAYKAQQSVWPELEAPRYMMGQIEQESCISLKSKKCWNPTVELKTEREYGFGLGQCTVTKKFSCFTESQTYDKVLATWTWEDRYNPEMQVRAMAWKDKKEWVVMKFAATEKDRLAMAYSAYNGGRGGLLQDRKLCATTPNCDATIWYSKDGKLGISEVSYKSKVAAKGYGKSFFAINREYPDLIFQRSVKYEPLVVTYKGATH